MVVWIYYNCLVEVLKAGDNRMFLTKVKRNGKYHLVAMESVYVSGRKYPKKVIKDDYGIYENAPENLRKQYEDKAHRRELSRHITQERRRRDLNVLSDETPEPINLESSADKTKPKCGNFNKAFTLRYGHLALKGLWEKSLGLRYKIDYLQKTTTKINTWQLNDLLFYLTFMKVLDPGSYLQASESKSNFLYCPWNGIAQDNFYQALDFVYDHRESLITHAVKQRLKEKKTEVKIAFFDCTNTWFETPYDDVTWQTIRFTRQVCKELDKQGYSDEEIEHYLAGQEFAEQLADELCLKKEEVLRMRGNSKEGRFAQPIVTVALAIDQTGFPIDCKVFAGNLSEMRTIKPMLDSLKEKYAVKDVYFVADRGLNSTENLELIQKEKIGFVVAQKVSKQTSKIRSEMLDLLGYRNCSLSEDGKFSVLDGKECCADAFRFKVCDCKKATRIEHTPTEKDPRKSTAIHVNCKVVYTFSPERKARDLADLDMQIARAKQAVAEGKLMGNPYGTGWRSLIKTQKEAAQNKTDKDQYRATELKEEVIEERKQIAGYAAVVFSHPNGENVEKLSDEQVLSTYHRLVNIEACFRTMKSSFSIRPVYVRLHQRIVAHCYLCVLALMLMRLLQERLEAAEHPMSSDRVCETLANAYVVQMPSSAGSEPLFLNLGIDPKFHTPERVGKSKPQWKLNDCLDSAIVWKRFEKERAHHPDDIDIILTAVGLQPLEVYNTMGSLKTLLGLKSTAASKMLAAEHQQYAHKIASMI